MTLNPNHKTAARLGGYYQCNACGMRTTDDCHLSCTHQCPDCGEARLVENLWGLTDSQSVPYKDWRAAWEISNYGRPRNTTPPPAWIPNMHALNIRSTIPKREYR